MSQTKTVALSKGSTRRKNYKTGALSGAGGGKRFYIGRAGNYDYASFGYVTTDAAFWSGVGKIVSAILTLYTDDGFGTEGQLVAATDHPAILLRRLTSDFSEHSNSPTFVTGDWTAPTYTSSGGLTRAASAGPLVAAQFDLTAFFEAWAPATVKTRSGAAGGKAHNYGFALFGTTDTGKNWAAISEDAESELNAYKPVLTLTYELGVTAPDVPSNLTPVGDIAALTAFEGDFTDADTNDELRYSNVQVYKADGTTLLYDVTQAASNSDIVASHFIHIPSSLILTAGTLYKWRARVKDQEGQLSSWSALQSFTVTNTAPVAPTLTPADASSYATLDGVHFKSGTFSDPDGDAMQAYQVQLSAYPSGDSHWDDDTFLLWNTGKRLVASGATSFDTTYGGASLAAGTYYWRARVWDVPGSPSAWTYKSIILTADFVVDPATSINTIQLRPRAPWRIVIRDMLQADGVTPTVGRGPGRTVAVLEDVYNPGASRLWNSPGEAHWTMPLDHPSISVIEPKQTHYAIEFRQGDGWREVYAGLVYDFDANDRDVIFLGIDYLALLDRDIDTRYDPANPDKPAENGGSKYVTAGKNSIGYIIHDLLTKAGTKANSLTGFITPAQSSATLAGLFTETAVCFSTYEPYLSFIAGLLDSHRAGTGKRSQIRCAKQSDGSYKWVVDEDPGQARDNLRLRYGELVQGFRVVAFGPAWSSRVAAIGRDKNGTIVRYADVPAPGFDETVWGRWATSQFFDGVFDANDFARKAKQTAVANAKLGRQIGVAIREGALQPRDGWDIGDWFPVDIEKGAVHTSAFAPEANGLSYWTAVGATWTAPQNGSHNMILTLQPREDSAAPDGDLLSLLPISPQAEWQIGWTPPTVVTPTSKYWLDQTTGKVYQRASGTLVALGITGDI